MNAPLALVFELDLDAEQHDWGRSQARLVEDNPNAAEEGEGRFRALRVRRGVLPAITAAPLQ